MYIYGRKSEPQSETFLLMLNACRNEFVKNIVNIHNSRFPLSKQTYSIAWGRNLACI